MKNRISLNHFWWQLLSDHEDTRFGSGWIAGVLSIFCGGLGLGGALCLSFPGLLTVPEMRVHYPVALLRVLIQVMIGLAFLLGAASIGLRRRLRLPLAGLLLAVAAALWGGGAAAALGPENSKTYLGFDWFLIDLLLTCLLFIPLEKIARRVSQPLLRLSWQLDLTHFFFHHLLIEVSLFLTVSPLRTLAASAVLHPMQAAIAAQPAVLQFIEILLAADLAEYAMHRAFHKVPWLWRCHAVHHSARTMDWLAASRNHTADVVLTRLSVVLPISLLGFAAAPVSAYVLFLSLHAVLIHANVNWRFGWLEKLFVTPRFHHWHHGIEPEAIDVNFAIHFPWIDRIFGTEYLPGQQWPSGYGIAGHPVPESFWPQMVYPLRRGPAAEAKADEVQP